MNEKHNKRTEPMLEGWWSNKGETRFQMYDECDRAPSVDGYCMSNPSPLLVASVLSSLEVREEEEEKERETEIDR